MARKQARRRKPKATKKIKMPTIRIGRIVAPLVAVGVVFATYQLSLTMLDRTITSIEISGPFQRVTALQIEEAIGDEIDVGFVAADLDSLQDRIVALPWIDEARVARRWPSRISITVTEQVPAAVWGESGLLNTRGELFVSEARHTPAELPRLSGPDDRSAVVAKRYLDVRDRLIPVGLDLRRVHLDARGSWQMTLNNGIEIRLGRRNVAARTNLFLDVVADIITSRSKEIDYVDMRYGNGFTIGWNGGPNTPVNSPKTSKQEMLALRGRD
ncbi:MAG: cell division protein FtsQ/DivIB [Gammaproteobacteria bacterium]|nr:cell division protein FtsQ/DivIB [Gammaproteobacteria bacterium]MBU2678229.1 cell division protein FtsQ/DivIB [Gammaproteobacteria bacterium]NNC56066.1 FtsQ-type POTRA domain-containing protein [Woeseiaceae bacterium]NNL51964.1 FtsQ-type POTRA domain-containing protein [Woeseiaceae bacterium]